MPHTATTPLAFAFALGLTATFTAPALADIVRFNAEIPNLGTVELTVNTDDVSPDAARMAGQREARAVGFAVRMLQDWSRPGTAGARAMSAYYDDAVSFYGSRYSYGQVLDDRYAFASRWPLRDYRVDPTTVQVRCDTTCRVLAQYDFTASNPATGAFSAGRSTLALTLRPTGGDFVIVSEDGRVLSRD